MDSALECLDYLRQSMLDRNCADGEFDWLDKMRAAYNRQGFLSPRQIGVLADLSGGEFESNDLYDLFLRSHAREERQ